MLIIFRMRELLSVFAVGISALWASCRLLCVCVCSRERWVVSWHLTCGTVLIIVCVFCRQLADQCPTFRLVVGASRWELNVVYAVILLQYYTLLVVNKSYRLYRPTSQMCSRNLASRKRSRVPRLRQCLWDCDVT